MGDVYRLVAFVSTFLQSFRFVCTDQDPWQMILWRGPRPKVEQRTVREIAGLSYADLLGKRELMNFKPIAEIMAAYRSDHHGGSRPED